MTAKNTNGTTLRKNEKAIQTKLAKYGPDHFKEVAKKAAAAKPAPVDPLTRFYKYAKPNPDTGCWDWTGAKSNDGYGIMSINNRCQRVHRWAYKKLVGDIADDLVLDHLCRNPGCVNPHHLEPVTQAENIARGIGRGAVAIRTGHCIHGHPLDGDNLYTDPKGHKFCRTCARAKDYKRRTKNRNPQKIKRSTPYEQSKTGFITCIDCNQTKSITEFGKRQKGKYYQSFCKKCGNQRISAWKKRKLGLLE